MMIESLALSLGMYHNELPSTGMGDNRLLIIIAVLFVALAIFFLVRGRRKK